MRSSHGNNDDAEHQAHLWRQAGGAMHIGPSIGYVIQYYDHATRLGSARSTPGEQTEESLVVHPAIRGVCAVGQGGILVRRCKRFQWM